MPKVRGAKPGECEKCKLPWYFIAVCDRGVRGTLGILYHYSVEYWYAPSDVPLNASKERKAFEKEYTAGQLAATELLRVGGWEANLRDGDKIKRKSVAVSVIYYSSESENVMPIFKSQDKDTVKAKWDAIVKAAKGYAYAEQGGFGVDFKHWPDSIYKIGNDVNNSNTFVRSVVKSAGLSMKEMSGFHPGRMAPQKVTEQYGLPVREGGEPPPPPGGK